MYASLIILGLVVLLIILGLVVLECRFCMKCWHCALLSLSNVMAFHSEKQLEPSEGKLCFAVQ